MIDLVQLLVQLPALGLVGTLKSLDPLFLGLPARLDPPGLIDQGRIRQLPEVAAKSAPLAVELERWEVPATAGRTRPESRRWRCLPRAPGAAGNA